MTKAERIESMAAQIFASKIGSPVIHGSTEKLLETSVQEAITLHDMVKAEVGTLLNPGPKGPACPHEKIIELYHELCPKMPKVRAWNGQRPKLLASRWKDHPDLDWWRGFLAFAGESKFLNGANGRSWAAGLEWLVRPANFQKINEGQYHR
mgnify:CR=1 FL=1